MKIKKFSSLLVVLFLFLLISATDTEPKKQENKLLAPALVLQACACDNNQGCMEEFLKEQSVNAKDNAGTTALHAAVNCEKKEAVEFLLSKNAEVNIRNNKGQMPLHMAVANGNADIVQLLISNGADVNANDGARAALHIAVVTQKLEVLKILLNAKGVNPNVITTGEGTTPLHLALAASNSMVTLEIANLLISKGADVNFKSKHGATPLRVAVMLNNKEMVKLFLNHGGDVNETGPGGTLLETAELVHAKDIAKLLRQHGAKK
jgi:ankyrin repeat protein